MDSSYNMKLKILTLMKIFDGETDSAHGFTMPELIQRLAENGIRAERKSVYRDIDMLREFGMDIVKISGRPVRYGLANRRFELGELMLVLDAVQSSRFLTERKSTELATAIRDLASPSEQIRLRKEVHVHGRPARQDMSDFRNVDVIQECITSQHKVSFRYFHYGAGGKKESRSESFVRTPICIIYSDGNYYMVAYDDAHEGIANFRVDRMERVLETAEDATVCEDIKKFDPAELADAAFGMFSGRKVRATFSADPEAMDVVIDRFGKKTDYRRMEDGTTEFTADVMESPVLFGWLAQLGPMIRIKSPTSLIESYRNHLESAMQ